MNQLLRGGGGRMEVAVASILIPCGFMIKCFMTMSPFSFLLSYMPCGFPYLDGQLSVVEVLDEPYSKQTPLSGVVVQVRQSTLAGTESILCSLAGRYGYSAERA
jgi:hypothetical protein